MPSSLSSLSLADGAEDKSKPDVPESPGHAERPDQAHADEERALSDGVPVAEAEKIAEDPGDPFLAKFGPNDPENPRDWSTAYKSFVTFQLGMLALAASLGSSIISPAEPKIAKYIGVSDEVAILVISLFVIGFAVGPIAWAPISEIWGRRWSLLPPTAIMALFSIGTATSKNAASIFITRFFAGVFGSGPVSNVGAAMGDIWSPKVRGTAIALYAVAVVGGPTIGPIIGAALTVNPHLGWRWTG